MREKKLKSFLLIAFFLFNIISCKNFFNGSEILSELMDAIEFQNLPYTEITITSDKDATESIFPAANIYSKEYKKGQKLNLSFSPDDKYQFVYWQCFPENSVEFKNKNNLETEATIISDDAKITIKPLTYIRPTVSISPDNKQEVPKNSPIVITFSKSLNIKQNQLSSIKITSDGIDFSSYFNEPEISEDNTQITILSKKLMNVTGTKTITVTIPKDFAYKADDNEQSDIELGKDFSYSYLVNNHTVEKVQLNLKNNVIEGELNITGLHEYYLNDEVHLIFTPNGKYKIKKWEIIDENNNPVPESIIQQTFSNNNHEITLKILAAISEPVTVRPYCSLIPEIISFTPNTDNGAVPQDSNIVITFNKPMNKDDFVFENGNITITQNELDKKEYFLNPELSEDGTILTIPTNKEKSFLDYDNPNNLVIIVKINNIHEAVTYENEIPQELEKCTFSYVIKAEKDSAAPKLKEIKLYKDSEYKQELSSLDFDDWSEETFNQNHVNKYYVKATGTDVGGGVYRLKIKETLLRDEKNNPITYPTITTYAGENKFTLNNDEYSVAVPAVFKSISDGLIKIELSLEDYAGNESTSESKVTYYMIKDTFIGIRGLRLWNLVDNPKGEYANSAYNDQLQTEINKTVSSYSVGDGKTEASYEELCKAVRTISVNLLDDKFYQVGQTVYSTKVQDIEVYCGQIKNSELQYLPESLYAKNTNVFILPENLDWQKDVYLRIVLRDDAGNEDYNDIVIKASYYNSESVSINYSQYEITFPFSVTSGISSLLCRMKKEDGKTKIDVIDFTYSIEEGAENPYPHSPQVYSSKKVEEDKKNDSNVKYFILFKNFYNDVNPLKESGGLCPYFSLYSMPTKLFTFEESTQNNSLIVPDYNFTIRPGIKNSNQYIYDVDFTNTSQIYDNYDYTIEISVKSGNDYKSVYKSSDLHTSINAQQFYGEKTFHGGHEKISIDLDSEENRVYYQRLIVKNKNGQYVKSEYNKFIIPKAIGENLKWDVTPPAMYHYIHAELDSFCILNFEEEQTNFKLEEDGKSYIDVWFVPFNYNKWKYPSGQLVIHEDEIPDNAFYFRYPLNLPIKFDDKNYYKLPFLKKGDYLLCLKVEDSAGNTSFFTKFIYLCGYRTTGLTTYNLDNEKKLKCIFTDYSYDLKSIECNRNTSQIKTIIKVFNNTKNEWGSENQLDVFGLDNTEIKTESSESKSIEQDCSEYINQNNTYYKIQFTYLLVLSKDNYQLVVNVPSNPYYYYNTTGDKTCNTKSLSYISDTTCAVACDKPCLVQVVCSEQKFEMGKVSEMEKDGYIFGTKQFGDSMIDFYSVDLEQVPDGLYYSVVAHFADGTAKMTDPILKK